MRKFIFSIIATLGIVTLISLVGWFIGAGIFTALGLATVKWYMVGAATGLGITILATAVVACFGVAYCIVKVDEKLTERKNNKLNKIANGEIPAPKPGLIKSYYKAVHDKICPTLEFK